MRINQIMLIGIALIVLGLVSAPLGLSLVWLRSLGLRRGGAVYPRRSTPNRPTPDDAEPRAAIRCDMHDHVATNPYQGLRGCHDQTNRDLRSACQTLQLRQRTHLVE